MKVLEGLLEDIEVERLTWRDLNFGEAILYCMRCRKPTVHEPVRKRLDRNKTYNVSPTYPKKNRFPKSLRCKTCGEINPKEKE